eukprot:COSAG02_NODE_1188_length_14002_cov_10.571244_8_plen_86_part_00
MSLAGMSNMGNSYAGNFGSWFTATLGITTLDYAGLETAQALRKKLLCTAGVPCCPYTLAAAACVTEPAWVSTCRYAGDQIACGRC